MVTYRVIAFGEMEDETGGGCFFQRCAFHNLLGDSVDDYANVYSNCAYTGAVLISVDEDSWQVIQEFGTEGVSIACGPGNNFTVEETPRLVLV